MAWRWTNLMFFVNCEYFPFHFVFSILIHFETILWHHGKLFHNDSKSSKNAFCAKKKIIYLKTVFFFFFCFELNTQHTHVCNIILALKLVFK